MEKIKFSHLEVRPGVFFPIPPRDEGFKLLKRRLSQLLTILFSKRFSPTRDFGLDIKNRYSDPKEVSFYQAIALSGFYKEEKYAVEKAIKNFNTPNSKINTLVLGSGTGREVFALEELGQNVSGFDNCPDMIQMAKKMAFDNHYQSNFTTQLEENEKFDLIYTTFSLTNHFSNREERVQYLNGLQKYMHDSSQLIFGGYFRVIKTFDRFWLAHYLLKMRWLLRRKIDPGTTVISHLGHHNDEHIPILFHFYQSKEEICEELKEAGFIPEIIYTPEDEFNGGLDHFWLAKKRPVKLDWP